MKFWEWLGKKGQRLTLISSILVILSGGGFSINKGIQWAKNYVHVPAVADSLTEEMTLMWSIVQDMHDTQKDFDKSYEILWSLTMANMDRYGRDDYIVTDVGDFLNAGEAINVFIRQDRIGGYWAFYQICDDGSNCKYYLYKAEWDGVYEQFYFIDKNGDKHLIYERD